MEPIEPVVIAREETRMEPIEPVVIAREETRAVLAATAQALGVEGHRLRKGDADHYVNIFVTDVWIPQDVGAWRAMLRIVPSKNGNPIVAEIRMFPREPDVDRVAAGLNREEWSGCYVGSRAVVPGSGLTARLLHAVKIDKARREGIGILRGKFEANPTGGPLEGFWPSRPGARRKRGGRKRIPEEDLVRVAHTYAEVCFRGSLKPVQVTAKHHRLTPTQARDWIRLARKRGILEPTVTTRPAGELTAKGRGLLAGSQRIGTDGRTPERKVPQVNAAPQ